MKLLQQLAAEQAARAPDSAAVVMGPRSITYGQLERRTNQLARRLKAMGCVRGDRVCLLLPKSPDVILSMIAILKADCIYVPMDPASPAARIKKIIDVCEPRVILASAATSTLVDALAHTSVLTSLDTRVGWIGPPPPSDDGWSYDFSANDLDCEPDTFLEYHNRSHDPAHILFTSGSTGVPKGVVITHANVVHFLTWALEYFGTTASDRVSGHPPLHFDLSTFDIFGTLAAGAELHLVPPELNLLPHKLAEFIRLSALTQWFSVPSTLAQMSSFDVIRFGDFPALKRVLWCGEAIATPTLIYWMKRLPHVSFTNLYGPTETTIASSFHTVRECPSDAITPIPIGSPCPGEQLLLLDDALAPAALGEIGNLYIQGVGLSPGYWRDPEKTQSAFVPSPFASNQRMYKTGDLARIGSDGLIYFVGRADTQIKSRGYRIELGEIEAALNGLGYLKECAVVAIPCASFDGMKICCAYASSDIVAEDAILRDLARSLPRYMLPVCCHRFEVLPKISNGKIDRRYIKEYFQIEFSGVPVEAA